MGFVLWQRVDRLKCRLLGHDWTVLQDRLRRARQICVRCGGLARATRH
jgi:hypothetical protein